MEEGNSRVTPWAFCGDALEGTGAVGMEVTGKTELWSSTWDLCDSRLKSASLPDWRVLESKVEDTIAIAPKDPAGDGNQLRHAVAHVVEKILMVPSVLLSWLVSDSYFC